MTRVNVLSSRQCYNYKTDLEDQPELRYRSSYSEKGERRIVTRSVPLKDLPKTSPFVGSACSKQLHHRDCWARSIIGASRVRKTLTMGEFT